MSHAMQLFKLFFRPRVWVALASMIAKVGGAVEDGHLSPADRAIVSKAFWRLVRIYRRME